MTSFSDTTVVPGLAATSKLARQPRICMPSWRSFKKYAFQGCLYEAQDVLLGVDDVEMICPEPGRIFHLKEGLQRRLVWRDVSKTLAYVNPGLRPVHLRKEYDLFVAICQNWWDILYLNAIKGWKDRCKVSVCWFDELWAAWIPEYRHWLHVFEKFDHVVLGLEGSVSALERALGRRCHWVPMAVDAVRFTPYPSPPKRVVDVYSLGRRWDGIHRSLLDLAAHDGLFYIYDTFPGSMAHPPDHRQHRELLANIAKRCRFFVVGPAKLGVTEDMQGQAEVGYRFFEGCMAGSVMIGQAPECPSFRELFGWPDAVIPLQTDGSDVSDTLSRLQNQPDRLNEIGWRNAREALLRHDWVYRWRRILEIAGLTPTAAMEERERKLRALAE